MNHDQNKREWEAKIINMRRVCKLGKNLERSREIIQTDIRFTRTFDMV